MSGVLHNGIQYEHCNECGKMVPIKTLSYEEPTTEFKYGRDLCRECVSKVNTEKGK